MAMQNHESSPCAELASLAVQHPKAAGIDVGDATHWVCIDADGGDDAIREFPAHTAGLRQLLDWLRQKGVTTVALEATGVYGHVLFLTLLEAGFHVITTTPTFTRQIKGRPKTDRRDCQWIQRLHRHGLLPLDLSTRRGDADACATWSANGPTTYGSPPSTSNACRKPSS